MIKVSNTQEKQDTVVDNKETVENKKRTSNKVIHRVSTSKDITGQKFGKLTAIEPIGTREKTSKWRCRCECGKEREVRYKELTAGYIKSCGCLQKGKDITGQKFGKLTAIRKLGRNGKKSGTYWECQCECGTIKAVRIDHLLAGRTTACGCVRKQTGVKHNRKKSESNSENTVNVVEK